MPIETTRRTVDHVLAEAREAIERVTPTDAYDAAQGGAVLVDVRSPDEQRRQGVLIPGALHHPLSVIAWRLDPACPTHNEKLPPETRVILLCREATRPASQRGGSGRSASSGPGT